MFSNSRPIDTRSSEGMKLLMRKHSDIESSGRAYVYEHWRPDLNAPFWVGKGTGFRYRVYKRRSNTHYNGIVAKLRSAGLDVEVRFVAVDLSDEQAFTIEVERMHFWRESGITLANKAAGGRGGMSGVKRSPESRAKQSASCAGRKVSQETRDKISAIQRSPERRAATSALHLGRKRPAETGQKIRAAHLASGHRPPVTGSGRKLSHEHRSKLSAAKTPEVRAKLSAAAKRQWQNPEYRKLVSDTMKRTNARRAFERGQSHA